MEERISELKKELEEKEHRIRELLDRIDDLNEKVEDLEEDISNLEDRIEELKAKGNVWVVVEEKDQDDFVRTDDIVRAITTRYETAETAEPSITIKRAYRSYEAANRSASYSESVVEVEVHGSEDDD